MVRLKVVAAFNAKLGNEKFQFHNGSIKSSNAPPEYVGFGEFQFHNGSIKSEEYDTEMNNPHLFQFHNGSIKRGGC